MGFNSAFKGLTDRLYLLSLYSTCVKNSSLVGCYDIVHHVYR